MKRISFYTLGCRSNKAETSSLQQSFRNIGYCVVKYGEPADVTVINTCTVTARGDSGARRLINRINRDNPQIKIALIGCQAQLQPELLATYPSVKWVVGNAEKMNLATIMLKETFGAGVMIRTSEIPKESFRMQPATESRDNTRANLKIHDGCNFFCTYCEIPYARGRSRSRDLNDLLSEAKGLVKSGYKEIVLTGINIGCYDDSDYSFLKLLKRILNIPDLYRLRISSIELTTMGTELLTLMRDNPKLCRHLHIPLQSGSDAVLKRMNRRYDTAKFASYINEACQTIPDVGIGTDIMVGFPEETEEEFQESFDLLDSLPLSYLHVFSYSAREHSKITQKKRPLVPDSIIKERSNILHELGREKKQAFMEAQLNKSVDVLFEQKKKEFWTGLTDNFIRVNCNNDTIIKNQTRDIFLKDVKSGYIIGN